ncbi:patatin-like phospholipase family protein [Nitrincola tibetensis]|uniref:Patatin-like phospholipase family protein n=1 Tax=Nitrincola tibetensis TaxID=2219697 RepID=A0A364NLE7_9GAMM|nr:patatin-like phospholipase family protein [Nitrincola tibetensis]RAU17926.1 patatin-like phospholipase family protein [Nitrincola tibetensis]
MKPALILSGGGARAAYQVGVLKALAEMLPPNTSNPFPIICGTSAGAINALWLASHPENFAEAVRELEQIWSQLTPKDVFKADGFSIFKGLMHLGCSLFNGGISDTTPLSLFDNTPLKTLLKKNIRFERLNDAIQSGKLDAISITAMGYHSGESVSFFQGHSGLQNWKRSRRSGVACQLNLDHLMASTALPTIFPAVHINREYFGDGAIRQGSPISAALHLGASKILVIGVSGNRSPKHWAKRETLNHSPSMAQIMGHLFNSAFIDALENDIEHMERVNHLLKQIPDEQRQLTKLDLKVIESLIISPSQALDAIAANKLQALPKGLKFALKAVGASRKGGGAGIASYLLFTPRFTEALITLGYRDTLWDKDKVLRFFK